jgi:hypothetical protein
MFPAAWGVLGLILMLAIVMGRPLVRRLFRRRSVPATWFSSATLSLGMSAAVWLFVPLLAAWLATRFDIARIFFPRYLLMSLPASWLLLVHATRLAPEWRSRWIFSAVIACGWVAYQLPHYQELFPSDRSSGPRGEDWRGAIAWLNEQLPEQPGPVLLAPGLIEERNLSLKSSPEWQEYCQFPVRALYRLDVPVEECLRDEKDSFPHMNVTLKLAPSSFYWQVERDDVAWDVRYQRIAGYVDSSSWRSVHWVERRSFGKVTVSRWKVTEYKGTAR